MTHRIEYEDVKDYADNVPVHIASSCGIDGSKKLVKIGTFFRVSSGKDEFTFGTLREAVEKYNNSQEIL